MIDRDELLRRFADSAGRDAAQSAEGALEWMVGEEPLDSLGQHRLQEFLWYTLPRKWRVDLDEHRAVARHLGDFLDGAGLGRYGALCRSDLTAEILEAYGDSERAGLRAFREAQEASGVEPLDGPDWQWGTIMGFQEAAARDQAGVVLERAVEQGSLTPGRRGWKQKQQQLLQEFLDTPTGELTGETWRQALVTERLESWLGAGRERRALLEPLARHLLHPLPVPPEAADWLAPVEWFLDQAADGLPLTQTGNTAVAVLRDGAARFGWDDSFSPRNEDDCLELQLIHEVVRGQKLIRRSKRQEVLTPAGRVAHGDPSVQWRLFARHWAGSAGDFDGAVTELALAFLLRDGEWVVAELAGRIHSLMADRWRDAATGEPVHGTTVARAVWRLARAGDVVPVVDLDWGGLGDPTRCRLGPAGRPFGLEVLRARGTEPRSFP